MTGARIPSPLEWVGPARFPWPPTSTQEHGAIIMACYGVLHVQHASDGTATLTLADARERIQALLENASWAEWLQSGIYVGVRGAIDATRDVVLLHEIAPVRVTLDDLPLFLPGPSRDPAGMEVELESAIASVEDDELRLLLEALLSPSSEAGQGFRLAPAATRNHHAHLGGLLEHTLSVASVCHHLAGHYGDAIDRDLLITAALLHDIGKVREIGAQAGFAYTDEGRLLGHILLGLRMVREAAREVGVGERRMLLLEHLIASHQGRYEWQSPREPRILEALLLHYADDLDAKFEPALRAVQSVERGWTERDRVQHHEWLRHVVAKPDEPAPVGPTAGEQTDAPEDVQTARGGGKAGAPRTRRSRGKRRAKSKTRKKTKNSARKRAATSRRSVRSQSGSTEADGNRDIGPPSPVPLDPHTLDMFGG